MILPPALPAIVAPTDAGVPIPPLPVPSVSARAVRPRHPVDVQGSRIDRLPATRRRPA